MEVEVVGPRPVCVCLCVCVTVFEACEATLRYGKRGTHYVIISNL
jgi:hypothetical protein